ncbi:MAG: hypothetical protein EHM49_04185 [Deltaproteobacteria bacterium]|nr:MAG: hypothetical protein EHM49_04185 [Deltaproteobacteria bacterium]
MAEKYISDRDTLERLARLEVIVQKDQELRKEKCEAIQNSIKLAKETVKEAQTLARSQVEKHFEMVNNSQERFDRAEATYATVNGTDTKIATVKEGLESKIESLASRIDTKIASVRDGLSLKIGALDEKADAQSRTLNIGIGIVLAVQAILGLLMFLLKIFTR